MRHQRCISVICYLSLAVLFAAVGSTAMAETNSPFEHPAIIIAANDAGTAYSGAGLGNGAPYWDLQTKQVTDLEAQLHSFLAHHADPRAKTISAKLRSYYRQYLGFTREQRKMIYINAFCEPMGPTDRFSQELLVVDDGGDCYFQVRYDPEKRVFSELYINGVA